MGGPKRRDSLFVGNPSRHDTKRERLHAVAVPRKCGSISCEILFVAPLETLDRHAVVENVAKTSYGWLVGQKKSQQGDLADHMFNKIQKSSDKC
jgi:pyruvate/2-oxoglutarate/acetoin dehydrogenase E1 component